jgi:hypothetical protein
MNSQPVPVATPRRDISVADFTPATAAVNSAEIRGRIGVDIDATISYQATDGFELIWRLVPSGPPTMIRPLDDEDLRTLLAEIQAALANPAAGLDTKALEAFADLIEGALSAPPDLFAQARFGSATEEVFGGTVTVIGLIGLGVDVVATIHDTNGVITWEHHPLPSQPGPFRRLTTSEQDGLTAALSAWLEGNPNAAWGRILRDLQK